MNYSNLMDAVNARIRANGRREITGDILNDVLRAMVVELGAGYQLGGTIRPGDKPKDEDLRVAYLAVEPGMYLYAGGFEVTELSLITYGAEWYMYPLGVPFGSQIAEDIAAAVEVEKTRAMAAEKTLSDEIDTERGERAAADSSLDSAIKAETKRATDAEGVLKKAVEDEKTRAMSAEAANAAAIASEADAREQADTSLQGNITAEETAREAADEALASKITAEEAARKSADVTLQANINTEETARKAADTALGTRVTNIEDKIPAQASSVNKLADKEFVNSSIATSTATFRGTFGTLEALKAAQADKNDYAFWVHKDEDGNTCYDKYTYTGAEWKFEYRLNNSSFTAAQWASINSGITDTWINDTNEKLENITSTTIIEITWSELKAKRDAGELTLGQLYRITDYQCTTVQSKTRSAGHQFDIIVLALSKNTLSERAYAALHSGDTYFANNNLSAWKLWYCLDNDTTRFAWADSTNGKGVIYRMIDEFNNDIPYDFKNIQFKHPNNTSTYPYYYYTFASDNVENNTDLSLSISNNVYSNKILPYISYKQYMNKILFIGDNCYSNIFGIQCLSNTFMRSCYYNIFGNYCTYNIFSDSCSFNIFGNYCDGNTFNSNCNYNIFGNYYRSNSLGINCECNIFGIKCLRNIFGTFCSYNTFGNYCQDIKFASNSSASTKYNNYYYNHFGDGCQFIVFTGAEGTLNVQNYNFAQGLQGTSDAYLTVDGVRNRSYETKVAKNSAGELKIYCEADLVQ